ncbi:MAG TPA: bifunctional 5,10-methylenetetrahydrofolate dehydrogenase/5,10-methenyltetrahydrofolate cyclohydrolase [Candidatus Limnocylindria bacterium]|nr:bifunctional 5,10-methylenetetrahydrofolate dehydrogenase/5,10-methenyltetrahydrofolate cyclohydrolase [Candidatus Limnocylindria bacterium]
MILDGRKIAQSILEEVKTGVAALPFKPIFCDILVGTNPESAQYVKMKGRAAEKVGIKFLNANFPEHITTNALIAEIKKLNQEPNICGLIVQLPLPEHLDKQAVLDAIDSKIDVDCTGKINTELFYSGKAYVEFPTAAAVMAALDSTGQNLKNKNCLVIGYGQLVGKPVSFLLQQRGLKVNVARSKTENILELMAEADVIVSAVGKPKLITADKIKAGCIIIDAGTSESNGGIVGDVDFESVKEKAGFVSPVPGGVGPVTVAKLLENVLKIAKLK